MKIPEVYPSEDVESMRQRILQGAKRGMPDIGATQAFGELAGSVFGAAIQEIQRESREKAIEEKKRQKELEQAEEKKDRSELELKIINYKGGLSERAQKIFSNEQISLDERWKEFEKESEGFKSEFLKNVPEEKKYVFEPVHAEAIWNAKENFAKVKIKSAEDEAQANALSTIETLERKAALSDKDRDEAVLMLASLEMPGFSEKGKQQIIQEFKERTAATRLHAQLNSFDVPEHKKAIEGYKTFKERLTAKDSKGNFSYLSDLDPDQRNSTISWIQNEKERRNNQMESEQKTAQREWEQETREMLSYYKDLKLSGLPIPLETEMSLFKRVKGTKFQMDFEAVKKTAESFGYQTEKFAKDPLTFGAAKFGVMVEPLNITDVQTLPQQIKNRLLIARKVQAVNDMSYLPLLTTQEVKGLTGMLKVQDEGGVDTISILTEKLGKEAMTGIANQVSSQEPLMGMVMGYTVRGDVNLAKDISKGAKILQDKALLMPKEDDLRGSYDEKMGDAMQGLPLSNNTHYQAFKAYYASLAAKEGISKESVKERLSEEAFLAVVGEVVKLNGKKVVVPDGFSEDRFLDNIKRIDAGFVRTIGGVYGMSDSDAAELLRDDVQWFVTSMPGVYNVAKDGSYLLTKDERYLEIHFLKEGFSGKPIKKSQKRDIYEDIRLLQ